MPLTSTHKKYNTGGNCIKHTYSDELTLDKSLDGNLCRPICADRNNLHPGARRIIQGFEGGQPCLKDFDSERQLRTCRQVARVCHLGKREKERSNYIRKFTHPKPTRRLGRKRKRRLRNRVKGGEESPPCHFFHRRDKGKPLTCSLESIKIKMRSPFSHEGALVWQRNGLARHHHHLPLREHLGLISPGPETDGVARDD